MEYATLIILILLSAFFSAAETALTSLSRIRVKQMLEKKILGAKSVSYLKENPAKALSTILFGNTLVNIGASVMAASMAGKLLAGYGLKGFGTEVGIVTGIMTFLVLVFGEIVPKTVALRYNEILSLLFAPVIKLLGIIFYPVLYILTLVSSPFIFMLGGKSFSKVARVTEEDIRILLSMGEKEGVIEENEREMIHGVFEIGETMVREVMTPKPDMVCVSAADSFEGLMEVIKQQRHSRIPIYEDNPNNIIGVIYAKDLLSVTPEIRNAGIKALLRPTLFIPESKRVDELMHQMQAAKTHMAVVVDEYGETAGLVTLEDLIEEIVGEIHDEFEIEERMVEKIAEHTYLVDAGLNISDANERLEIKLPESDGGYNTVGGFMFEKLGKLPSVGAAVKYENLTLVVEKVLKRRITRVRIMLGQGVEEEGVGG